MASKHPEAHGAASLAARLGAGWTRRPPAEAERPLARVSVITASGRPTIERPFSRLEEAADAEPVPKP